MDKASDIDLQRYGVFLAVELTGLLQYIYLLSYIFSTEAQKMLDGHAVPCNMAHKKRPCQYNDYNCFFIVAFITFILFIILNTIIITSLS